MSNLYEVTSKITLVMSSQSITSRTLGILKKGTQIEVISLSRNWAYFKYNSQYAYILRNTIKFIGTIPEEVKGFITLKYLIKDTNTEIYKTETITNLTLGTYSYTGKSISKYNLLTPTQTVTLTQTSPNITLIFYYSKILCNVTINYVDEATNLNISNSTIWENLELGSYTYNSINIIGYTLNDNENKTITLTESTTTSIITFKYTKTIAYTPDVLSLNKVPYISTYYFKTKPRIDEDLIIPFYATNYEQSDYLEDSPIELDILYQIDDEEEKVVTVMSGDNSLNLGKLIKGEHYFSLQAHDKTTGLKSHKLYNDVLVIDDSYEITDKQTYIITDEDLSRYNITNIDTTDEDKMTNTRLGLTKLFSDLQGQGYRKCILPYAGYFRVKKVTGNDMVIRNGAIQIPSNFTVDMNNSTFKLHTNTSDIGNNNSVCDLLVRMYNCYDSHLINGILEGDRSERKALGLETDYKGEPIATFQFVGGKYSSIENLLIKQTTGHTVISSGESSGDIIPIPNTSFEKIIIYNGKNIETDLWSTSSFIDLSKFTMNYLTVGRYLGYRGVRGKALVVYYNFYDENYNFIKMIVGYQYRKSRIPNNVKYVRVSLYGDLSQDTNVSMFYFELGTNLEIKNIDFEETRTCAIAITTSSGLLIDNVTFTKCGYKITPCPVDFEDGWQDCQDIYFMNSRRIGDRVGTADIIDNAGYNHVYENNDNLGYIIRYSVIGVVIKNNKNIYDGSWTRGYETGSKFGRIQNNIINGNFSSNTDDTDLEIIKSLLKNSTINGTQMTPYSSSTKTFGYYNCNIYNLNGSRIKAINSNIHVSSYLGNDFIFENCVFYNFDNINSNLKFSFNTLDTDRIFNNCIFKSPSEFLNHNYFNSGNFKNCIFEKTLLISPAKENILGDIIFENCTFKDTLTVNINNSNCYIKFINCIFEKENILKIMVKQIVYLNNFKKQIKNNLFFNLFFFN